MNRFIKLLCLNALLIGSSSLGMDADQDEELRKPTPLTDISWTHALLRAAACGSLNQVQELLDAGVPVDATCSGLFNIGWGEAFGSNRTPLGQAAWMGHKGICQLLIDHNAQLDAQDNLGYTPLMCAGYWGRTGICKLLVDAMLKPIKQLKQNQEAAIALLGMKMYRRAKCMDLIDPQVIRLIARQVYEPVEVSQKIKRLFDQINAILKPRMQQKLLVYARTQLNIQKQNNHCIIA